MLDLILALSMAGKANNTWTAASPNTIKPRRAVLLGLWDVIWIKMLPCPGDIARRVLPRPARFITFCIAVRTIEAWLLADVDTFANAFRVAKGLVSREPERLDNPKSDMLRVLARSSARDVRDAMVRETKGGLRRIGPEYNTRLSVFAESAWRPTTAEQRAPSLQRARLRIAALASRVVR